MKQIKNENYLDRGIRDCQLFVGRFQPIHIGHKAIVDEMVEPFVAIIKGKKSSQNKNLNPLPLHEQCRLIARIMPKVNMIVVESGYIPDIINRLRGSNYEVGKVYCGEDRYDDYVRQVSQFNDKIEENKKIISEIIITKRICSATEVRKAIIEENYERFQELMPDKLHEEYEMIKSYILS